MSLSNLFSQNPHSIFCKDCTCDNMNVQNLNVSNYTVGNGMNVDQTLETFNTGLNASNYHLRYEKDIFAVPNMNGLIFDMNATGPNPVPQANLLCSGSTTSLVGAFSEDLNNGNAYIGCGLLSSTTLLNGKKCTLNVDGPSNSLNISYGYSTNADLPLSTYLLNSSQSKADSYTIATANILGDVTFQNGGNINANAQIKNVTDPTSAQDCATKNYVDNQVDNNIYDNDGTIQGNRIINGNNKVFSLTNTNIMTFSSASQTFYIGSSTANIQSDASGAKYNTSGVLEHIFNNNINLSSKKLLSVADGTNPTDGINKNQLDSAIGGIQTIYNSDSTLSGSRIVDINGHNLTFSGNGSIQLNASGNTNIGAGALTFGLTGALRLEGGALDYLTINHVNATPNTSMILRAGGFGVNNNCVECINDSSGFAKLRFNNVKNFVDSSPTHFLSVNSTTGDISQSPISATQNIYNTDSTLTGNRHVQAGGFNLRIDPPLGVGIASFSNTQINIDNNGKESCQNNTNGNSNTLTYSSQSTNSQITLSFEQTNEYRHSILTTHDAGNGTNFNNRIDFCIWNNLLSNEIANTPYFSVSDSGIGFPNGYGGGTKKESTGTFGAHTYLLGVDVDGKVCEVDKYTDTFYQNNGTITGVGGARTIDFATNNYILNNVGSYQINTGAILMNSTGSATLACTGGVAINSVLSMASNKIINLSTPTTDTDAMNLSYWRTQNHYRYNAYSYSSSLYALTTTPTVLNNNTTVTLGQGWSQNALCQAQYNINDNIDFKVDCCITFNNSTGGGAQVIGTIQKNGGDTCIMQQDVPANSTASMNLTYIDSYSLNDIVRFTARLASGSINISVTRIVFNIVQC